MERNSYYFTLGQNHIHLLGGGVTWDKDGVVLVKAINEDKARQFIVGRIGLQWGHCYTKDEIALTYYPKGIIRTYEL